MRRYAYKLLYNPSEKLLNEHGEQGWRVAQMSYGSSSGQYNSDRTTCVIMERANDLPDPNGDRL
jgi:hypothetical protein